MVAFGILANFFGDKSIIQHFWLSMWRGPMSWEVTLGFWKMTWFVPSLKCSLLRIPQCLSTRLPTIWLFQRKKLFTVSTRIHVSHVYTWLISNCSLRCDHPVCARFGWRVNPADGIVHPTPLAEETEVAATMDKLTQSKELHFTLKGLKALVN